MGLWQDLGVSGKRVLILHHDDLGVTYAHNQAYRELGFATGSVMASSAWARELRGIFGSDLGVHVTLTSEWPAPRLRPISEGSSLRDPEGYFWPSLAEAWKNIEADQAAVEIGAQVEAVRRMGIDPTHMDTHMGAVLRPDIAARFVALGGELGLPVMAPANLDSLAIPQEFKAALTEIVEQAGVPQIGLVDTYDAPMKDRRAWYVDRLSALGPGVYHVLHHAQKPTDEGRRLGDWEKRRADLEALADPEVKRVLAEFVPLSYKTVRDAIRNG